MARKHVYFFGGGKAEGKGTDRDLLGGKGAGLAEMTSIGLPVPGGFTIDVEACAHYSNGSKWISGLEAEVRKNVAKLEKLTTNGDLSFSSPPTSFWPRMSSRATLPV